MMPIGSGLLDSLFKIYERNPLELDYCWFVIGCLFRRLDADQGNFVEGSDQIIRKQRTCYQLLVLSKVT